MFKATEVIDIIDYPLLFFDEQTCYLAAITLRAAAAERDADLTHMLIL